MTNPLLNASENAALATLRSHSASTHPRNVSILAGNVDTLRSHGAAALALLDRIDYWRWFKVAAAVLNLVGFTYLLGMFLTYTESFGWHAINSIGLLLMGIYHLHAVWTMESDDGIKTLLHSTGMYVLVIAY